MGFKVCTHCQCKLRVHEFYTKANGQLRSECKRCCIARTKLVKLARREHYLAYHRRYNATYKAKSA